MAGTLPTGIGTPFAEPPQKMVIPAAPTEIVPVKPAPATPGWKTSEGQLTALSNAAGLIMAVTDILPPGLRWVGVALIGVANVAYTISRGLAKR